MIWKQIQHLKNLQNWKLCKYLSFCQNEIPKILKKNNNNKKNKKFTFRNTKCIF